MCNHYTSLSCTKEDAKKIDGVAEGKKWGKIYSKK